jgi:hypothetical protein
MRYAKNEVCKNEVCKKMIKGMHKKRGMQKNPIPTQPLRYAKKKTCRKMRYAKKTMRYTEK